MNSLSKDDSSKRPARPRGKLWAFSGLDGAGKTTQIALLVEALQKAGSPARIVWARGGYTPGFEFLKRCARSLRAPGIPTVQGRTPERERAFRRDAVRRTWLVIAVLDLLLYYGLWIRVLRLLGWNVVADRYLFDTEVDFRLTYPDDDVESWALWRLLKRVTPKPDRHFVMLVPVEESLRRSVLKGEPFADDEPTLTLRLAHYERWATNQAAVRLDGTGAPHDLHRTIIRMCALAI